MNDIRYWIWLSSALTPGSSHFTSLISKFGDAESVYSASADDYEGLGLSEQAISALNDKSTDEANKIYDYCLRNDVNFISYDSPIYPDRLKMINNPPVMLYFKGTFPDIDDNVCIAMVGTRTSTEYGRREAYTISYDLALGGAIIVSGLARGIDSICHNGCIDAFGKTVAVLGCGIDVVYPPENAGLYTDIMNNGAVVTEFKPGTRPFAGNFPIRNRIISGLSLGTLVIEAGNSSGSLITAKYAEKQGRDVFALPGKIGELGSTGTNKLIKDGCKMVTEAKDILEEYEFCFPHRVKIENLKNSYVRPNVKRQHPAIMKAAEKDHPLTAVDKEEISKAAAEASNPKPAASHKMDISLLDENSRKVYGMLPDDRPSAPDELVCDGLGITDILVAMTMLEINGFVSSEPGGKFKKI